MEIGYALTAAAILAVMVIVGIVRQKKEGVDHPCTGCPNYSNCRAHVGCNNNINRKKK